MSYTGNTYCRGSVTANQMSSRGVNGDDLSTALCALTWRLVRLHGWAKRISIDQLAQKSNYSDEKRVRGIIRNELSKKPFVTVHPAKGQVWVRKQDKDAIRDYLVNECGYQRFRVNVKLESNR